MSAEFETVEKTFLEIKRLVAAEPFVAFRLRAGGIDIPVDHPNSVAFHPEVPYLTVHTREEILRVAVEDVEVIRESYQS